MHEQTQRLALVLVLLITNIVHIKLKSKHWAGAEIEFDEGTLFICNDC